MERITMAEFNQDWQKSKDRIRERQYADRLWIMRGKRSGFRLDRVKGCMALMKTV